MVFLLLLIDFFIHKDDMTFVVMPLPGNKQHPDNNRTRRNAIPYTSYRWPNGRIPYQIASSYDGNYSKNYEGK